MKLTLPRMAAAAAIVGFLGIGGITLASAQEDPTTTTTVPQDTTPSTAPDATAPDPAAPDATAPDGRHCDHDGAGTGSDSSTSATPSSGNTSA
jgi:hypothetical protein